MAAVQRRNSMVPLRSTRGVDRLQHQQVVRTSGGDQWNPLDRLLSPHCLPCLAYALGFRRCAVVSLEVLRDAWQAGCTRGVGRIQYGRGQERSVGIGEGP